MADSPDNREPPAPVSCDVVILGGGIAGLWLLNRLRSEGYAALLIEQHALGAGQTLASQGMIHGGIKYTLDGMLTDASETIAAMPGRWRDCLAGRGEVDLQDVSVLSGDYYLFSDGRLTSRLTSFFGSRAVEGRVDPVERDDLPEVFRHPSFQGLVYRLQDVVIDTPVLVDALARQARDSIFTGNYQLERRDRGFSISLPDGRTVTAPHLVLAAGEGNGALAASLDVPAGMQLRPLNQVIVRGELPRLFAHGVSLRSGNKPRLTITTHDSPAGRVWYLGGQLAESGVARSDEEQCRHAREELGLFFPWMDFGNHEFTTLRVNRAEAQSGGQRPDTPYVETFDNVTVCWPTKLTLVPMMADTVLEQLAAGEQPGRSQQSAVLGGAPVHIAPYPWDEKT